MMQSLKDVSAIKNFLLFFIIKLRLSNPWKFKAPPLITIPYFVFLFSKNDGTLSFYAISASIAIILGVAGLGYLTNDMGDREKDKLANKSNATSTISAGSIVVLFAFFLVLAILPWVYLPFTVKSLFLLIFQFFLFYAYAFKPFRMKEKGFFGVLTDSLYAHVVPAILASYTFYVFTNRQFKEYLVFLILLCGWQFFLGVRNILFHQLKDFDNDKASNTITFAGKVGFYETIKCVKYIILPIEICLLFSFIAWVSYQFPFFFLLIFIYWIYKSIRERKELRRFDFQTLTYKYLDDLYIQWMPFIVLLLLCCYSKLYIPIFILHFLLFRSEAKTAFINYFQNTLSKKS